LVALAGQKVHPAPHFFRGPPARRNGGGFDRGLELALSRAAVPLFLKML
jgi:hypothetical protein